MLFPKRPMQQKLDFPRPRRYQAAKHLASLLIIGLLAFIVSQAAKAQTGTMASLNEAESGQLLFQTDNGQFQQAVHLGTEVEVQIQGMIARVQYRQTFKNDSRDWREAVYVFPLAENAAVNEMEIRLGERVIRAEIKEKAEARAIYEQAKSNGQVAALTEQQRPNLFTQSVANIAPGEQIEVILNFVQAVSYDSGTFSFYLPTTITPRFMPGPTLIEPAEEQSYRTSPFGWAQATTQVPDADRISPFMLPDPEDEPVNPIQIDIQLEAGLLLSRISSRNHDIDLNKQGSVEQISLSRPTSMNRDFWLEWVPIASAQPEAAVFQEHIDGEDYALLMLLPPQIQAAEEQDLPREVVFIIDTSGSMGGSSIDQAKSSLQLALRRIDDGDLFNIIEFNTNHRALFAAPVPANQANLQLASNFVRRLRSTGGTNMLPALAQALSTPATEGYLKQVLFITDGAIGNEAELFELIHQQLDDARLFTVGIGSAPNSHFMSRAARFGRGTYEYISQQSEISGRMNNLFRKLESPILSDLQIQWPDSAGADIEFFPERIPDLYSGEPLVMSVKASELNGELTISGATAQSPWTQRLMLQSPQAAQAGGSPETSTPHTGVATLWARHKIAALMDGLSRGRNAAEVRTEVLQVAIPHKLISAYTSLVAVEERIVRPDNMPLRPAAIPNAVGRGQNLQPQTYPQTATWLPLHWWVANLSLLALISIYRNRFLRMVKNFRTNR